MRLASEPARVGVKPRAAGAPPPRAELQRAGAAAAEIGTLFRDLRRALKLSLPDLATRLGTRVDVLSALERGEVRGLPPWPETVRLVTAFTGIAAIDPGPVLVIIRREMELVAAGAAPKRAARARRPSALAGLLSRGTALASGAFAAGSARVVGLAAAWGVARYLPKVGWKTGFALGMTVLSAAIYLAASSAQNGSDAVSLTAVSAPLVRLRRSLEDYVLWWQAPTREGLKWIEVDDPRTRRADRLEKRRP